MGFPKEKYCTHVAQFSLLERGCALCDPSQEGGHSGSLHVDCQGLHLMSFPLIDPTEHPFCVTVMNLSHEYVL